MISLCIIFSIIFLRTRSVLLEGNIFNIFVTLKWFIFTMRLCSGRCLSSISSSSLCRTVLLLAVYFPVIDFKSDTFYFSGTEFFLWGSTEYSFLDPIFCIIHFCQKQNNHEILYTRMDWRPPTNRISDILPLKFFITFIY